MVDLKYIIDMGSLALIAYYTVSLIAFIPAAIDILRSRRDVKYKIVWLFICIVLGVIGIAIYYFIEKRGVKLGFPLSRPS
jgi:undecaprenyl pyrophosphate phosphatase UppP